MNRPRLPRGFRVTVYAGSSLGTRPTFAEQTETFVRDLVRAGAEIVYGGARRGLMGVVADTALAAGGAVTGVIPSSLVDAEISHTSLTRLHVVNSMSERKELMVRLGDCFVALPGGVGTAEELFEVWSGLILGHLLRPVAVLNIDGYWDPLLSLGSAMTLAGFLSRGECRSLLALTSAADLLSVLEVWKPPPARYSRHHTETQMETQ